MSRLIVKNLPKNITDTKVKELFSQKGLVTDVQLKYTKDGKFRRFAFIGFKTEEQAIAAKEYFDKTCIDTCRVSVEQCASLGDSSKPRAWSKYAPDSSKSVTNNESTNEVIESSFLSKNTDETDEKKKKGKKDKKEKVLTGEVKDALEKYKDDPLFMEFLESHALKKTVWNNDTTLTPIEIKEHSDKDDEKEEREEEEGEKQKIANKVISDLEYMEALKGKEKDTEEKVPNDKNKSKRGPVKFFTVKLRGLAYSHKKKDIKQFFRPLQAKSIRVPPKIKGIAYVGFKSAQHLRKALLKNKSFLDGRQIFVMKYEEQKEQNFGEEQNENNCNVGWKKQEEALKDEESIAESGRMFIRNLSYTTTEDDIRKLFEKYGPLIEVNLPIDRTTRKPKGFGTVTFLMTEHAVKAYSKLDGSIFDGRMLHLLPAKAKSNPMEELDEKGLTYKQKKELQAKATAGSSHNWNTLFLGQNAVADAIAATYNTTKEKVLEDGSKGLSAAVKLALGETQLVQDTKNFLEENGVCLDAFNQPTNKRSKIVILVKNLPAATPVQEIRQMFAQHGELGRVVMPPSGITALVEFLEPSEARKAFTKLAYTKYKHLPLYLEWGPDNSFTTPPTEKNKKTHDVKTKKKTETEEVEKQAEESSENINDTNKDKKDKSEDENEDEEEPEPDTTLFVKNINFATTEEQLKTYFGKCGPLHYATIATKKDPKNPGAILSMGYGFVRYKRKADTDRALKVLQMTVLDGKSIELKRSERTLSSEVKTAKKMTKVTPQTGTKILIRNVPFQATAEEITELFKAFGELKAVRLPRKLVGVEKHRGFAFVEYYTKSEAKKAFKALCQSTHLYGRRLVLEWAQTEEGIEDIRKRTAKHFYQEEPTKRGKKATLNPEDVGLETE
ncbi:putative RNA-binding protein 19 [Habropoda laboriosa]|uniref:Putative RNA-binding protein 19 n=1 Tax=Habropoda laboriosa TaxID=597456 RepID=A0A0L7QVE2_9HYME|nr:PREDICTED: probable RNA-binding protein 19 [Habropoda laboriosa]KOC62529.1 putative RNA-binding protein 19 [Habropoda laboriosa]